MSDDESARTATSDTYARLAAAFDKTHLLRKGNVDLDYLTTEQVVSRLTEVLGLDGWEFEVREHGRDGDSMWALGRLIAYLPERRIVREQFGECSVTRGMNAGDSLKGAGSDALKKCASLIGVGLYLSRKEETAAARAPAQGQASGDRAQPAASTPAQTAETSKPANVTPIRASTTVEPTKLNHENMPAPQRWLDLGYARPTKAEMDTFHTLCSTQLDIESGAAIRQVLGGHDVDTALQGWRTNIKSLFLLLKWRHADPLEHALPPFLPSQSATGAAR